MKKTFITLLALAGVASANYVWNGGKEINSEKWSDSSNWILDEGDTFAGNGPGMTDSEMWESIYVANASGSVGNEDNFTLEGWNLSLYLSNEADLTFQRIKKFQNGSYINIDATSSLSIYSYYGGSDGGLITLDNKGSFTLGYSLRTQGGEGFAMNLYDTGIVNLVAQNTNDANSARVKSVTAQLVSSAAGIETRTLVNKAAGVGFDDTETTYAFTDAQGAVMTAVDSLEALATATAPSYFVSKNDTGIHVSYVGIFEPTEYIPEPATATLSLLALAGLAARRRRK